MYRQGIPSRLAKGDNLTAGDAMVKSTISTDLTKRVALVTGASSGIGGAVAQALAANGASVWVNHPDESTAVAAEGVASEIRAEGGIARVVRADVSSETEVAAMFEEVGATGLDILVNNAGIAHSSPIEEMAVHDFDRLFAVHVRGTFLCTRSALKIMYAQNSGRIINTASQLAYIGAPGFSHYTAAKGAILSFTRSLALEIGDRPITANCVAPGATMTPILADVPDDILEAIRQNIPAGRIAEVEDIVGAYVFLASEAASHFRGQCLSPNGGDAFL